MTVRDSNKGGRGDAKATKGSRRRWGRALLRRGRDRRLRKRGARRMHAGEARRRGRQSYGGRRSSPLRAEAPGPTHGGWNIDHAGRRGGHAAGHLGAPRRSPARQPAARGVAARRLGEAAASDLRCRRARLYAVPWPSPADVVIAEPATVRRPLEPLGIPARAPPILPRARDPAASVAAGSTSAQPCVHQRRRRAPSPARVERRLRPRSTDGAAPTTGAARAVVRPRLSCDAGRRAARRRLDEITTEAGATPMRVNPADLVR